MPISEALQNLINAVDDPARRAQLQQEAEQDMLRQQDYSRKMNETAAARKEAEALKAANEAWYEQSNAKYIEMQEERDRLRAQLAQQGVNMPNESTSTPGAPIVDDSVIAQQLRAAREEAALAAQKAAAIEAKLQSGDLLTKEQFLSQLNAGANGLGEAIFKILEYRDKAETEYGIKLNPAQIAVAAGQSGNNFDVAYEQLTKEARDAKYKETVRQEIEKEYQAKYAQAMSGNAVPLAGQGTPISSFEKTFSGQAGESPLKDVPFDTTGRFAAALVEMDARGEL